MGIEAILKPILDNQVVTGLSFTAILGGAMYQLRTVPYLLKRGILRFFTVELTVLNTDQAFDWLDRWMAAHPYTQKTKMMQLRAMDDFSSPNSRAVEWTLSPGPGTHMFWWRKRPIVLNRTFLSKEGNEASRGGRPVEQMHFRTIGRSQLIIRALIAEAQSLSIEDDRITIRIWDGYEWHQIKGKNRRLFDTIVLREGQIERIVNDVQWFIDSGEWYLQRGIPYRRGYLFSGPPGTGKTSIVLALAGFLKRPICVINLGAVGNDNALFEAFREAPLNAILLMEDIDCAFPAQVPQPIKSDDSGIDKAAQGLSKAGLLNAIDGVTTPDGRIFIMTTNHPERLDSALVRPGRADVQETFEYFGAPEQIRMASRFYSNDFEALPFSISPAEMQAGFMQFVDDPKRARAYLLDKFTAAINTAA